MDKTTGPIEPLNDTWGTRESDNYWTITSPFDFTSISTQHVNAWFAKTVVEKLKSFFDLAPYGKLASAHSIETMLSLRGWSGSQETPMRSTSKNVLKPIREYPAPIYDLDRK